MPLPTAEKITNLYLYGQKTTPTPTELVSDKWIRLPIKYDKDKKPVSFEDGKPLASVDINASEFMSDNAPGRFAIGGQFEIVKYFFDPSKGSLPVGVYTKQDIADKLFFPKTGKDKDGKSAYKFSWEMEQHKVDDGKPDYAERGYIYNTLSFSIRDDAKFIVDAKGKRSIKDFAVIPNKTVQENFDFDNKSGASGYVNPVLVDAIDPSRIGRKVLINFIGTDAVPVKTYDKDMYANDKLKMESWSNLTLLDGKKMYNAISGLVDNLWKEGVIGIRDDKGRPIIYATNEPDVFDVEAFLGSVRGATIRELANKNGVVLVTGKGDDTITNFPANSVVHGGDGVDTVSYQNVKNPSKIIITEQASQPSSVPTIDGTTAHDVIINVEKIRGSANKDEMDIKLLGNSKVKEIDTGAGNDVVSVKASGETPNLVIKLGDGNDTLKDTPMGGIKAGSTTVYGGAGNDLFFLSSDPSANRSNIIQKKYNIVDPEAGDRLVHPNYIDNDTKLPATFSGNAKFLDWSIHDYSYPSYVLPLNPDVTLKPDVRANPRARNDLLFMAEHENGISVFNGYSRRMDNGVEVYNNGIVEVMNFKQGDLGITLDRTDKFSNNNITHGLSASYVNNKLGDEKSR